MQRISAIRMLQMSDALALMSSKIRRQRNIRTRLQTVESIALMFAHSREQITLARTLNHTRRTDVSSSSTDTRINVVAGSDST